MVGGAVTERKWGEFLMADYLTTDTELASVANAIRSKGGTSSPLVYPTGFVSAINAIPSGGGGSVESNDVNFRDYDGTITNSYTKAEFLALSAMPANPSHDGLTAQGWNWSLADAQAYVTKYGRLEIGQMYITDDGKTRVYIHLEEGRTSPMLGVCPDGTVDVDWGDGTAHDMLTGTDIYTVQWTPNHTYAAPGDYVIKLTVTGSIRLYGHDLTNQYSYLLRYASTGDSRNYVYRNAIQKVEIGSGVTGIGDFAFDRCYGLSSITIPDSVTRIGDNAFNYCYGLSSITIPDSVTRIYSYAFAYSALTSITIPDSVTRIDNNAFYGCSALTSITIPDSVTRIDNYAFDYCYALSSITIPDSVTIIGINAFNYCYSLASVIISDSVTSISNDTFNSCYSLASVTIPDSVTRIGDSAFSTCYSAAEYHLTRTAPPTLSNTNAFNNIPADCIIYVPYSADHSVLNAYKTASNWSTYANYMQEEPQ